MNICDKLESSLYQTCLDERVQEVQMILRPPKRLPWHPQVQVHYLQVHPKKCQLNGIVIMKKSLLYMIQVMNLKPQKYILNPTITELDISEVRFDF